MNALSPLAQQALAIIRQRGAAHEEQILNALFPPPQCPGSGATDAQRAAWQDAREIDANARYGGDGRPYRTTYAYRASAAVSELTRAGLVVERNNGFNSYAYTALS